ncbi:CDP-alcohol phosphatidyltransferase family protein [Tannerella forsythia]|uniref:CDP-alcohol phosphatidyltransferase family protein n=1 Tax=Tannerella forsythia TaxID=28112 RepID=UPI00062B1D82|nr:CDP-alcohol phosphatidyltransferase family protein [Tannerella forsythia]KKY61017.1 CDP-alcohol phosphatidyltransferase [Tannerella forsythia]PDP70725.1 CDP-alcohol phosphatidyltransferase [Tannerella forsythia]TPE18244.1 CDP-alcohol phosphatidyltransferase family protein [Tannerella forsythia]
MDEKEYETSLKSIETENIVDLYFYRPIGFRIARMLRHTGITPNMITFISIFVGAGAGWLFYFTNNFIYTLLGILLLVFANILDCVDGQLARLTGIKSEIGRILDGIAGDIWFTVIYVALALRLTHLYGTAWFFVPAVAAGLSHLLQAGITDYYKTLHLYFVSKEKGKEFQRTEQVKAQRKVIKKRVNKFFYVLYALYTWVQERLTPALQTMLHTLHARYGDDIPEPVRLRFRKQSRWLMKRTIDWMTFNGRTTVLFAVMLLGLCWSGIVWIYFAYEIIVLNTVLYVSVRKHERMCATILKEGA